MNTLKKLGRSLLILTVFVLTWFLSAKVCFFLYSLIDFRNLHWAVNILVGLVSMAVRFLLPPVLAIIAMYYATVKTGPKKDPPADPQIEASDFPENSVVLTSREQVYDFLSTHELVADFETKVVGVTYSNKDGTSRQRILSRCSRGDEISLEFFTYKGAPAYAVISPYGQIGNLDADLAYRVDKNYDGCTVSGMITSVTGGHDSLYYGCVISLQFFRPHSEPPIPQQPTEDTEPDAAPMTDDELFNAAVDLVIQSGQASISMLQRKLKVGYARAARTIDELEELGIIGPFAGSKPRAVMYTQEQWETMRNNLNK